MAFRQCREALFELVRRSYGEGLVRLSEGNFSLRCGPEGPVAITPAGMPYDGMTPDDLVVVGWDGRVAEGRHRPSSELPMHLGILRARPDVAAVAHTHSPFAVALAVLGRAVPPVSAEALEVGPEGIPLARFALPGTADMALAALEALERGRARACLLQNHGALAVGATPAEALAAALYAEASAQAYYLALAVGEPIVLTPNLLEAAGRRAREAGQPAEAPAQGPPGPGEEPPSPRA